MLTYVNHQKSDLSITSTSWVPARDPTNQSPAGRQQGSPRNSEASPARFSRECGIYHGFRHGKMGGLSNRNKDSANTNSGTQKSGIKPAEMVISPYFTQKKLEANRNYDQSNKLADSPTITGTFMVCVCVYTYIVNNIIDIMSRGILDDTGNKSRYDFYGTFLWAQKQQTTGPKIFSGYVYTLLR